MKDKLRQMSEDSLREIELLKVKIALLHENDIKKLKELYDLKLENGLIKLYSQEEIDLGRAIGLQKKPFVRQIDLIERDFISFITNSKEAKYKKTTDLNDKKLGNLKETQITSLPEMLKIPCDCYEEQNN